MIRVLLRIAAIISAFFSSPTWLLNPLCGANHMYFSALGSTFKESGVGLFSFWVLHWGYSPAPTGTSLDSDFDLDTEIEVGREDSGCDLDIEIDVGRE